MPASRALQRTPLSNPMPSELRDPSIFLRQIDKYLSHPRLSIGKENRPLSDWIDGLVGGSSPGACDVHQTMVTSDRDAPVPPLDGMNMKTDQHLVQMSITGSGDTHRDKP